jgi:two-component system sensor histidine kinase FlrB
MSVGALSYAESSPAASVAPAGRQDVGGALAPAAGAVRLLGERERLANRLSHLLAVLPAGALVINGDGTVQEANAAASHLLGEPLLGAAWSEVIARAFAPRAGDGCEISLRDGRRVSVATQALTPEPGQIVLLTDMTTTRALQADLARHERLSAMGEMAASLAHQLRTPLASALLYVSQLTSATGSDAQRMRVAEKIRDRLRHLEHLVSDMLLFARGGASVTERLAVTDLIAGFERAVELPLKEHGCTVQIDHDADGTLIGNREALLGALLNLALNAMQACGTGGRLTLRARPCGDSLELTLADNGPGISPQVAARIFEPFYTTRAQGTGLGLAVVQAVVRAHHGDIRLQSPCGTGACFVIRLPLAAASPEVAA